MHNNNVPEVTASNEAYQDLILPGVSRTFALTIPQLPDKLAKSVTNAYLLCRAADTIEDEVSLSTEQKDQFLQRFVAVLDGRESAACLSRDLTPHLSAATPAAEIELVENLERVLCVTRNLSSTERTAINRCVSTMCQQMLSFQKDQSVRGLENLDRLDRYCYAVAGVVGEMLTELFSDYSARVARNFESMHRLAPSFGQGLQMTNILKDVWDDLERDVCWLPRDIFAGNGSDLASVKPGRPSEGFTTGLRHLIGIAHAHLRNALTYTLLVPRQEAGIRRFCLWNVGLAVLTLRRINQHPNYVCGDDVKISHAQVGATTLVTRLVSGSDSVLRMLFDAIGRGLPLEVIDRNYFDRASCFHTLSD